MVAYLMSPSTANLKSKIYELSKLKWMIAYNRRWMCPLSRWSTQTQTLPNFVPLVSCGCCWVVSVIVTVIGITILSTIVNIIFIVIVTVAIITDTTFLLRNHLGAAVGHVHTHATAACSFSDSHIWLLLNKPVCGNVIAYHASDSLSCVQLSYSPPSPPPPAQSSFVIKRSIFVEENASSDH